MQSVSNERLLAMSALVGYVKGLMEYHFKGEADETIRKSLSDLIAAYDIERLKDEVRSFEVDKR
jgi:hypothetical protein